MTPEEALNAIRARDYEYAFHGYFSIPAEVLWQEIVRLRALFYGSVSQHRFTPEEPQTRKQESER